MSDAFESLMAKAQQARAAHEFADAVRACEQALAVAPRAQRPRVHLLRLEAIDRGALADEDTREKEALAATSSPSDAIDVRLLLGRIALRRADFARAVRFGTTMRTLLQPQDKARRAKALCLEGMAKWSQGALDEAILLHSQAATLCREAGDPLAEATALNDRGLVRGYTGDFSGALADHEAALRLVVPSKDPDAGYSHGQIENDLGFALWNLGRHGAALAALTTALDLRRAHHDLYGEGITLNNIGNVHRSLGRTGEALAHYEDAAERCRRSKNPLYEAIALNNMGQLAVDRGELERAERLFIDALAITERIGDRIREADNRGNLGALYLRRDDPEKALTTLDRAVAMRRQLHDHAYLAVDAASLAVAFVRTGDLLAAKDTLAEVDELLRKGQQGIEQAQWVHLCAHYVHAALGDVPAAAAALEKAVAHVQREAAAIADPAARAAYLQNLAVNREIRAAGGKV